MSQGLFVGYLLLRTIWLPEAWGLYFPSLWLSIKSWRKVWDLRLLISLGQELPKTMSWRWNRLIGMYTGQEETEPDMEQQSSSKLEKEYVKAVYCHPDYLTYMQSTSRKMLGWMKHKLESRLPGEISITSDMQMTPPLWQKVKRN